MDMILHITTCSAWDEAVTAGSYHPSSLESDGFIHCSTPEQTTATANLFFTGSCDLVLLCIDPALTGCDLRYEPPADNGDTRVENLFPHLYGPLRIDAVVQVVPFPPDAAGRFHLPEALRIRED